ncbi:MAG: hypothetical protein V4651_00340, partial [Bacteroidota bacterium]
MNNYIHPFSFCTKTFALLTLLLIGNIVSAQNSVKELSIQERRAEECFKSYRYLQAIDAYLPIVKKDSN